VESILFGGAKVEGMVGVLVTRDLLDFVALRVFLSVGVIVPMAGSTVILGYNGPDPYIRCNIPFLGLNGPYSRKLLFESTFEHV
jgi:hypothetical protein